MKKILAILILIFFLQTPSQADDIRDFQIGGITVGDSLLDFYNEKKIKEALKNAYYYKNKKFADIFIRTPNDSNYEWFQITIKPKDKNFIVYTMTGQKDFINNIKDCYLLKKEIVSEIKNIFSNDVKIKNFKQKHGADKSGKSIAEVTKFIVNDGSVEVECYDWSKKVEYTDKLMVNIKSDEFIKFMRTAYK